MPSPVRLGPGTLGFPGDVTSVFGRVGAVIAVNGDYTFAQIGAKPTTLAGYGITNAQPLDADLTAIAALATTAFGRGFLIQADASASRTYLGLSADFYQGTTANYAGIASGTGLQAGVTGGVAPVGTGRVLAICSGRCANSTAGSGWNVQLRRSSVAGQLHPANGDTLIGSAFGAVQGVSGTGYVANQQTPFSIAGIVTGLTLGSFYWFDIMVQTVTGGTAQVTNTAMTLQEF